MRILTMAGPGAQRGLEFGRLDRTGIPAAASALKSHLAAAGHSPDSLGRHLAASPLCRVAEELTPDLWAEVVSIAAGSRASLEDILLLTFLDEVWRLTGESGCSALALRDANGHAEVGQTMDLPAWTTDRFTVLRTAPVDGLASLVMTYPGMIGLCGANIAGLGVAVNTLHQLPFAEDGLAVAFIARHLLTLPTLEAARQFLQSVPHAVGQAYTIAAVDGIATFEASADGVEQVSERDARSCAHTNHPLERADLATGSSQARLATLQASVQSDGHLADALSGDVVLDGRRLGDPSLTFGAFRFVVGEGQARFIDGTSLRTAHREWTRIPFH